MFLSVRDRDLNTLFHNFVLASQGLIKNICRVLYIWFFLPTTECQVFNLIPAI